MSEWGPLCIRVTLGEVTSEGEGTQADWKAIKEFRSATQWKCKTAKPCQAHFSRGVERRHTEGRSHTESARLNSTDFLNHHVSLHCIWFPAQI